jgi:hypothetical protein
VDWSPRGGHDPRDGPRFGPETEAAGTHLLPKEELMTHATMQGGRSPVASEQTHVHPEERLQALTADLHHRIQVAAYYLAERRGSEPGHELNNWFAAEEFIASDDAARTAED